MKVIIKPFKDYYPQFGISNVNLQEYKERYKNKIHINKKGFSYGIPNIWNTQRRECPTSGKPNSKFLVGYSR